jgi:hypothetical protein
VISGGEEREESKVGRRGKYLLTWRFARPTGVQYRLIKLPMLATIIWVNKVFETMF